MTLAAKDRRALVEVLGEDAATDEHELRRHLGQGASWRDTSRIVRAMALRKGLLEGDAGAMWAGLKQAVRLAWLAEPDLSRPGGIGLYHASLFLLTGDQLLFDRWLAAQPRQSHDGDPWTAALRNAIAALGHGDARLIREARPELAAVVRRGSAFDKATAELALAVINGNRNTAARAVAACLAVSARFAGTFWLYRPWFLAVIPIALTNLMAQPPAVAAHPRWAVPPRLNASPGAGLVDLTEISPDLEHWWRSLPPALPHQPRVLAKAPAGDPRDERGLMEAVAADPESDAPREVYADWLLERGLVRGEFIRLQLRKAAGQKLTKEELSREKLLAKGVPEWLGLRERDSGLAGVGEPTFERGFLARCTATKTTDDLRWATVVELHGCVPAAATRLPALSHLSFRGGAPGFPLKGFDLLRLPKLVSVVALGTEEWVQPFEPTALAWLWSAQAMQGVTRFACPLPAERVKHFFDAWMPRLSTFTVCTASRAWNDGHQVRFVAVKGGHEVHLAAAGKTDASALARGLGAFAPGAFERAVMDGRAHPALKEVVATRAKTVVEARVERVEAR